LCYGATHQTISKFKENVINRAVTKIDQSSIHHDLRREVVEDGRVVDLGEGVGGVADQHARLAHGAVSDHHAFD
jgi:hypothetical protein